MDLPMTYIRSPYDVEQQRHKVRFLLAQQETTHTTMRSRPHTTIAYLRYHSMTLALLDKPMPALSWKFLRFVFVARYLFLVSALATAAAASTTTNGHEPMHHLHHYFSSSHREKFDAVIGKQDDDLDIFTFPFTQTNSPHVTTERRTERKSSLSPSSSSSSTADAAMAADANSTYSIPSPSPSSLVTPSTAVLKSPWWTKIREYAGPHSYNFVPGSRRAASSVVYSYTYHSDAEDSAHRQQRSMLMNESTVHDGFTNNMDDTGTGGARDETIDHPSSFVGSTNSTKNTFQQQTSSSKSSSSTTASTTAASSTTATTTTATTTNVHKKTLEEEEEEEEYMIVSGGYTDHDWKTFPIYAFPITSAIHTSSGQWVDLTPSASKYDDIDTTSCHDLVGEEALVNLSQEAKFIDETTSIDNNNTKEKSEEIIDPWKYASPCAPFGRMGHISAIHDDKLYVFGGLIYAEDEQLMPDGGSGGGGHYVGRRTMFQLENIPYVYRLDLKEMLDARRAESEGNIDLLMKKKITGWQRIIPRVKKFFQYY